MLLLAPSPVLTDSTSAAAPSALHGSPFANYERLAAPSAPAVQSAPVSVPRVTLTAAERSQLLGRRRALLIERARALGLGLRPRRSADPVGDVARVEGFAPVARQSLAQIEAQPLLSPQERARVRLEVALARDNDEWQIGRAAPCRWLAVVG